MKTLLQAFLLLGLLPIQLTASPTDTIAVKQPRSYTTSRLTTSPPEIDGVLTDGCWTTGAWVGDYVQWLPKEGARPSQPTFIKLLYDDLNIYVGIRAVDSTIANAMVQSGRRDQFTGDMVGITFDSYHDHRTGFEFDLTAAGQKVDLILTNSGWDVNWNAVWFGKTAFEDSAWTAEFRIPLSQLRYSSDSVQVWGMHAWRWIARFQEESDWEPQSSTGPGALYLFGELHGLHGLPSPRRVELMPYGVSRLRTYPPDVANPFAASGGSWFGGAGLDAKIGLSSNVTADVTLNPDFGQVEADPSVMNLTAFETFYEERRPFFLEARTIFAVDDEDGALFYSRRIGHTPTHVPSTGSGAVDMPANTTILEAVKVSGKSAGGLAVGLLHSLTAREWATVANGSARRDVEVEPLTSYTFARVQQDLDNSATVIGGAIGLVNRFMDTPAPDELTRNAATGGLDVLHQWADKEYFVDLRLIGSAVNGSTSALRDLQRAPARYFQRPDAPHLSVNMKQTSLLGHGGSVRIGKGSKGVWRYDTGIRWRSPGLEINDLGFMQQVDVIAQVNHLAYFTIEPTGVFRSYSIKLTQTNTWDFGGEFHASAFGANIQTQFPNQWSVNVAGEYTTPALDTRLLRGGPAVRVPSFWNVALEASSDGAKDVSGGIHGNLSASGEHSGSTWSVGPYLTILPHQTVHLSFGMQYEVVRNDLQYVGESPVPGSSRYILGRMDQQTVSATMRADVSVTPEFGFTYYGSPFASVGRFSGYKMVTASRAEAYADRIQATGLPWDLADPSFAFGQFRSNLVFRWEYLPGSNLYVVWSQDRTMFGLPDDDGAGRTMWALRDVSPENVFMMKCSYWFSL